MLVLTHFSGHSKSLTRCPFPWNSTHGTWTHSRMGLRLLHALPVSLPWFFLSTYNQASSLCLLALMSAVCSACLCLGYSGVKFQKRLITTLNKHPYFITEIFLLLTLCGCRQRDASENVFDVLCFIGQVDRCVDDRKTISSKTFCKSLRFYAQQGN